MKKAIYILLLSFVASLSITACTEEQVGPASANNGGEISEKP